MNTILSGRELQFFSLRQMNMYNKTRGGSLSPQICLGKILADDPLFWIKVLFSR